MARKRQTRSGDRLREFDELFNLFVENVRDYAIFMTDANGSAVSWNAGVERLLGYSEEEFLGTSLTKIYTPEDVSSGAAAREIATAGEKGRSEDERWHLRKDGSRFWASGVLTALREDGGRLRGFAKVMRDITERKLAEEERKQLLQREQEARQAAEGATRIRDQFLATVSHELRTPLNAILGWARILEDQTLDPARVKQAVETISRNAVLQSRLIDDLLDISRILADRATIERRPVDFLSIVQGSVESLSPNALEKDVIVECRLRPLESMIDGDPRRLQQIVWNLLSNAIKFTPDGGRVSIDMEQDGAGAVLTVSDTGIGIPPEFLSRLFDPFSQADMTDGADAWRPRPRPVDRAASRRAARWHRSRGERRHGPGLHVYRDVAAVDCPDRSNSRRLARNGSAAFAQHRERARRRRQPRQPRRHGRGPRVGRRIRQDRGHGRQRARRDRGGVPERALVRSGTPW